VLQGFERDFHLENNSLETTLLEPAKVKLTKLLLLLQHAKLTFVGKER
jgi:hypothetical protein